MNFMYSFHQSLVDNDHNVVGYMLVRSFVVMDITRFLSDPSRSMQYWFAGNRDNEIDESCVLCSETKTCDLYMSLSHAILETLFASSKRALGESISFKIGDSSELCSFSVIV